MAPSRIFVYGTLRDGVGHEMSEVLVENATLLGAGAVRGQLFSLGSYPGLKLSEGPGDWVKGEVYELTPARQAQTIASLDDYEGVGPAHAEPQEYRRQIVQVSLDTGETVDAWAYVLNLPSQGLSRIPSGDFLEWQQSRDVA